MISLCNYVNNTVEFINTKDSDKSALIHVRYKKAKIYNFSFVDNNYEFVDGRSDMCKLIALNHENANIEEVYFCFTDEKNKPLQY